MSATIDIAPALAGETQIIAEMSRRLVEAGLPWTWTAARVARHLQHPDSLVLTARNLCPGSPELAGFAIMHFGDEIAHLNLLAVQPRWQRKGIGRRLLAWLEKSAITAGTFSISLEVRARNRAGLLFYRELGFEDAGRIPRYYSGREDALRLAKDLRHPLAPPVPGLDVGMQALPAREEANPGVARSTEEWLATRFRRRESPRS